MPTDNLLEKVIENANNNVPENENQGENPSSIPSKDGVKIYSGDAISEDIINSFFSPDFIKLIVLAGLPSNGKTTLISSVYDKFIQDGEFGGFEFAGSKTILGFEKRCYLSRLKNGQRANTRRTTLSEDNPYLDLSLINRKNNARHRLMFVDTSGEVFKKFQKDDLAIQAFKPLLRANHFSYIFDISQFNESNKRHLSKEIAKTIIRSIKDQNMFSPNVNIEIVFTKWDKIIDDGVLQKYRKSIVDDVKEIFPSIQVKDFNVNSISDVAPFQLLELFKHWMNTSCVHEYSNELKSETIDWEQDYYKYLDNDE